MWWLLFDCACRYKLNKVYLQGLQKGENQAVMILMGYCIEEVVVNNCLIGNSHPFWISFHNNYRNLYLKLIN